MMGRGGVGFVPTPAPVGDPSRGWPHETAALTKVAQHALSNLATMKQ